MVNLLKCSCLDVFKLATLSIPSMLLPDRTNKIQKHKQGRQTFRGFRLVLLITYRDSNTACGYFWWKVRNCREFAMDKHLKDTQNGMIYSVFEIAQKTVSVVQGWCVLKIYHDVKLSTSSRALFASITICKVQVIHG